MGGAGAGGSSAAARKVWIQPSGEWLGGVSVPVFCIGVKAEQDATPVPLHGVYLVLVYRVG
jgi:hypothetical protein